MSRPPDTRLPRPHRAFYAGRRVLVTGGLGFIGSNLSRELVALGARVTIVDALIPDYGGNRFNIDGIEDRLRLDVADVRDRDAVAGLVRGQEVIFNLAGQVSHIDSMRDPHTDLEINCRAQLSLLEACRAHNPGVKVVFAGTRQVYGRPSSLPVTEDHLVKPTDVNGINKAAGEYYHLVYNNVFGIRACSLRLTNVFGPRQLLKHNRQGFIGWFIRLAIEDREIQIYGDGSQVRDLVFVDDAVDAFLRAGASDDANGRVFNVGGFEPITHRALVERLIAGGRQRPLPLRRVARREARHRHRQLLRRLVAHRAHAGLAAGDVASTTACSRRCPSTGRTWRTTFPPRTGSAPRERRPRRSPAVPRPAARSRCSRRARRDRARPEPRLVRARAGTRSVRIRVRGGVEGRDMPSAPATAPTRLRWRCARPA